MPLYPPVIGKLPLSNLGKRIRGVKVIELERGLSGQVIPTYTWDTNPNTGLWHYCNFDSLSASDSAEGARDWSIDTTDVAHFAVVEGKNGNAVRLPSVEASAGQKDRFIQPYFDADFDFDGSEGTLTDFTIRLWFKTAAFPGAGETIPLITKRVTKGWGLTIDDTNITFIVYGSVGGADTTQLTSAIAGLAVDTWHYVLAMYDSVSQKIHLKVNNGAVAEAAHTAGIEADSLIAVEIGTYYSLTAGYTPSVQFSIDELAIWSRVLSANDITHDYNAGDGKFWPNLA